MEHVLAWRPSGNLIASSQRLPHRHDVVFFERNGLRHGEFTLPDLDCHLEEMQWNADSSILAIRMKKGSSSIVQLWGSKNYHWYLKQELKSDSGFVKIDWDSEKPFVLHTLQSCGIFASYHFALQVYQSASVDASSLGTVAVIDGRKLN